MPSNPAARTTPAIYSRILGLFLIILALLIWLFPLKVLAASPTQVGTIQVQLNNARVRYREGVDFQVRATVNGGGPVTQAQLKVKYGKRGAEISYDVPLADGSGSHLVQDETENLTTGMPLIYSWVLSDGKVQFQTSPQTVYYEDTRQAWRQREGNQLTVRWYDGDDQYGSLMYQLGADALATYKRRFNIDPTQQIYITIYGSSQAYHVAFPEAPSWSGGLTRYGGVEIIVIAPQNLNSSVFIGEGIPHELSHAALYQFLGAPAPRWLDEGFAVYNQNTITIKEYDDLVLAASQNNALIPLKQLDKRWPSDAESARLAYAEGRSIVTFLINTYGNEAWSNLLDQLRRNDIDGALNAEFGVDLSQMETLWKSKVLANDKSVKMPAAFKLGPVPSQPTAEDLAAKTHSKLVNRPGSASDGPSWIIILVGMVVVLALVSVVVILMVGRYKRLNSLAYYDLPNAQRALQEQQYLKSRVMPVSYPAQTLPEAPPPLGFSANAGYFYSNPNSQSNLPTVFNGVPAPIPSFTSQPRPANPVSAPWPPVPAEWNNPGSVSLPPPLGITTPASGQDPYDLIISSFNTPGPSPAKFGPPLSNPVVRPPESSSSFLNIDPYGLNFETPNKDNKAS